MVFYLVVTVALVRAVWPERPHRTRLGAVMSHPTARTPTLPVGVEALCPVLTPAPSQATPSVGSSRTRLLTEEPGVTRLALALAAQVIAGSVTRGAGRTGLLAAHPVEALGTGPVAPGA